MREENILANMLDKDCSHLCASEVCQKVSLLKAETEEEEMPDPRRHKGVPPLGYSCVMEKYERTLESMK